MSQLLLSQETNRLLDEAWDEIYKAHNGDEFEASESREGRALGVIRAWAVSGNGITNYAKMEAKSLIKQGRENPGNRLKAACAAAALAMLSE